MLKKNVNELTITTGLLHIPSAKVHCTAGVSELGIQHKSHFPINYLAVQILNSSLYNKYAIFVSSAFVWLTSWVAPRGAEGWCHCKATVNYLREVIVTEEQEHSDWRTLFLKNRRTSVHPCFKKGGREYLGNYRCLSVSSHCLERWWRKSSWKLVLNTRTRKWSEEIKWDLWSGNHA